jgi:GNAT superfamily N-acetyltransferase
MTRMVSAGRVSIRPYRHDDEAHVLELLAITLGGGPVGYRSREFFRWKHAESPFGRSFILVAEADRRIIGLRAFMRWRFRVDERVVTAVRAVDTATHPDYQRTGVFSQLTRRALGSLAEEVDLVFNTPNQRSLPGYLKLGWQTAGKVPVLIRVRRPARFAWKLASRRDGRPVDLSGIEVGAEPAGEVLSGLDDMGLPPIEIGEPSPRLHTQRDPTYLRWRYGSAPHLDYRVVRDEQGGRLRGLAIFRLRGRGRLVETTVTEVLTGPGDVPSARRLLRRVVAASPSDHLTCHFPVGSAAARAARRSGFLRTPAGMVLVVKPLRAVRPDPTTMRSWGVTLGDLEVF